ncbi:MAG: bifunctional [glutamine synthetase] adenylyltransferase/[glutamine synthetase]-adenylyl-L-tyrosine phosphorylase [Rhodospirillaceae bacterium]|nr:bifunctional [glutamine synthetase] adenylyltransferase/[glutamine synthetase]-adenylyl-L-tyrosine phosphorylase [Rhodospirillaceae bacterium]
MTDFALNLDPADLPPAPDPSLARAGLERWRERLASIDDPALTGFADRLDADPDAARLLALLFAHSSFLGQCLLTAPADFRLVFEQGPEAAVEAALGGLVEAAIAEPDPARVMQALRAARRRVALAVATADIVGAWPLEQVTAALSDLADRAIDAAAGHLLRRAVDRGELEVDDPEQPHRNGGLIVLGLGKLGARELNYSSDVDLIILFDREKVRYTGSRSVQDFFVRIARDLVRLLQERTEGGFVLRVDLRLRPDPGSTPLALSALAAENYYEGMGQNWERAAMIKARPVAADIDAGRQFLERLRPFIWRKHLDFAAIQDIHSIKRQIHAVKGFRDIAVAGHNIKLGRGGIREIEFFAQTQQLIWGGRDPALRVPSTCVAIRGLVASGRVEPDTADELIAAYRFLRGIEHRLQMMDDRQTQTLPAEGEALDRFAAFAGFASTAAFAAALLEQLGRVEDHYADLFEEAPSLSPAGSLVFTGGEDDPDTLITLAMLGFRGAPSVAAVVRSWHAGRYRATRSTRARELLTELVPDLLKMLGRTSDPDAAFQRFDAFLQALPSGVQLFSLIYANPGLLGLIAEIMGDAPRLADRLAARPALLEGVLTQDFFAALPGIAALRAELDRHLQQARDLEDCLDITRRWAKDRQFQAGVHILRNVADAHSMGGPIADIAETAIRALLPAVTAEFEKQHGKLPGRGLAVIGLGKLGGREMNVGSDLDLVFIYDVPAELGDEWTLMQSDGSRPLAPMHYYARLAQRTIGALDVATTEGRLFEVDMRLRPSGNSGPIASGLAAFGRYQREEAWTWEHMSLTRARVVAGDPSFATEIEAGIRDLLCRPRDGDQLVVDIADMRRRMAETYPADNLWDVKHWRGGMVDVDFIAQYLQLRHAESNPAVLSPNTRAALTNLAKAGLLDREAAEDLIEAVHLWHNIQGLLRLTVGHKLDEAALPAGIAAALAAAGDEVDFRGLKQHMIDIAELALGHYRTLIDEPADAARPRLDSRETER